MIVPRTSSYARRFCQSIWRSVHSTAAQLPAFMTVDPTRLDKLGDRIGPQSASAVIAAVDDIALPGSDVSYGYLTWSSTTSPVPLPAVVRPDDVCVFAQARFKGKLGQSSLVVDGVGILADEVDVKKSKFKVFEVGAGDEVEVVSYSLEALKSGSISLYRVGLKAGRRRPAYSVMAQRL